jgi:glucosamine--fructose-6-phosphate aminotransferase (isomerizing)
VQREVKTVQAHTGAAELGPYRHYMQKEIFEQPRVIGDTLEGVTGIMPELFGDGEERLQADRPRADPGLRHQLLLGLDRQVLARIGGQDSDVNVEIASEYRYRDSVPIRTRWW